jgi:RNA polymerase sigma-70 factor (ECF subfamily)
MPGPSREVTALLQQWSEGDATALADLMALVIDDLRQLARKQFQRERSEHTLQPTALINEVYLRLYPQRKLHWESRGQFFAFAAMLMRRILVDHAKARLTTKRGQGTPALPLDEAFAKPAEPSSNIDFIALDDALSRLAALDPRQAQIVELRYYVGLTNEEIARELDISVSSVKRDWTMARAWLYRELKKR